MATVATLVALPVLIHGLVTRRDNASVAALPGGADIADSLRAATGSGPAVTSDPLPEQRSNLPRATSPTQPPVLDIAVPASDPATQAKGGASYRHFAAVRSGGIPCATALVPTGTQVRVENLDNGHGLRCVVVSNGPLLDGVLIAIDTGAFAQLGDPVQAPLPVRVTW